MLMSAITQNQQNDMAENSEPTFKLLSHKLVLHIQHLHDLPRRHCCSAIFLYQYLLEMTDATIVN